jgi:ankyrin repeat protein
MPWDAFYRDTQDALRGGADPNHKGEKGITLLHYWVSAGRADIAELLLDNHADVNVREEFDWTALHFAAANGHLELVKLLIARGADLRAQAMGTAKKGLLGRLFGRKQKVLLTPRAAALGAGHPEVADYIARHEGPPG